MQRVLFWNINSCTAKNATDLLQVVNFTGLLQLVDKLQQPCQFHQVATSLLKSGLLQLVICRLVTTFWNKFGGAPELSSGRLVPAGSSIFEGSGRNR